ncbi:hypothetical protein TNCV_1993121 [Trichonephila clavipes]|nr:hypothetical protein TNCV_1993121 [Trichonephila clavipes]
MLISKDSGGQTMRKNDQSFYRFGFTYCNGNLPYLMAWGLYWMKRIVTEALQNKSSRYPSDHAHGHMGCLLWLRPLYRGSTRIFEICSLEVSLAMFYDKKGKKF